MTQRPSVIRSTAWAVAEAATLAVVSFATLLATAWLLGPADFGIAATALTVVQVLLVMVGAGLVNGPLIQREDLRQEHIDTVYWAAFGAGCVLVGLCWLGAGELARRVDQPELAPVLAVFVLMVLPTAYESVQVALLRRAFGFRQIAIRTFVSRIAGSVLGVGVALLDGGPWSIVVQHLATVLVSVAILRAWTHRPIGLRVSLRALREVMGFSAPAVATEVMSAGGPRLLQLAGAVLLGPQAFAFLHIGLRIVETLREMVTDLSNNLAFPMFSRVQGDRPMLARHFLAATAMLCAVAMPGFLGIGAFAGLFVPTLVGPAWLEAVPVVQVLAFGAASGFAAALCFPLLWAVGRPALGLAPRAAELVVALVLLLALEAGGPAMAAYAWAARQVVEVGFAVLICPRVLPLRVGALPGAVAVPAGLAAGAVLGLLALRQVALAGLPPVAQLALLGGAGAVLTVVAAGIVQPALARAALGRIWPRRG